MSIATQLLAILGTLVGEGVVVRRGAQLYVGRAEESLLRPLLDETGRVLLTESGVELLVEG